MHGLDHTGTEARGAGDGDRVALTNCEKMLPFTLEQLPSPVTTYRALLHNVRSAILLGSSFQASDTFFYSCDLLLKAVG